MARIIPTTPETAPDATKPILAQLKSALGMIPNLFATIGHAPATLQAMLGWDAALSKGALSKREVEILNLHVSELNGCAYCVSAHTFIGGRGDINETDITNARAGRGANEREDALLAFARRVVRTGGGGAGAELARLRKAGVSDAAVVDVLSVVALKTFTNAIALVAQTDIDFPRANNLPTA